MADPQCGGDRPVDLLRDQVRVLRALAVRVLMSGEFGIEDVIPNFLIHIVKAIHYIKSPTDVAISTMLNVSNAIV